MDQALELLPADYWRWWLLRHAPESSDTEFTWEHFQSVGEQGPGRCAGQFRQPDHQVLPREFGEAVPEGGEPGAPRRR